MPDLLEYLQDYDKNPRLPRVERRLDGDDELNGV